MRTTRQARRRRVGHQRHEELDHQLGDRRLLRRVRGDRPRGAAARTARSSSRRTARASASASSSTRWGSRARRPARRSSRTCACPQENVIGEVGKGMAVALGTLERTRLGAAAQAVGIAQGAIDYAAQYAKRARHVRQADHRAPGRSRFKLAEMEARTAAARELLYRACAMADRRRARAWASGRRWPSCSPPTPRWG